jgi:hypothetical protein
MEISFSVYSLLGYVVTKSGVGYNSLSELTVCVYMEEVS